MSRHPLLYSLIESHS